MAAAPTPPTLSLAELQLTTQYLYQRIVATEEAPAPVLQWVTLDHVQLRNEYNAIGVGLNYIPVNTIDSTLSGLIFLINYYLEHQPNLTRAFQNQMEDFFMHADRAGKTGRIMNAYNNALGAAGAPDAWTSLIDFLKDVRKGAEWMLERQRLGTIWALEWAALKRRLA